MHQKTLPQEDKCNRNPIEVLPAFNILICNQRHVSEEKCPEYVWRMQHHECLITIQSVNHEIVMHQHAAGNMQHLSSHRMQAGRFVPALHSTNNRPICSRVVQSAAEQKTKANLLHCVCTTIASVCWKMVAAF